MTFMSPNRLVMQRCWGLPLTLLNRIGQPPSNCFWMPVISRLGSTSLSVTIMSPSFFIHSIARRRSLTSSGAAPSRFAFAIAPLQIIYVVFSATVVTFLHAKILIRSESNESFKTKRFTFTDEEISESGCLDRSYAYTRFLPKSTNAATVRFAHEPTRHGGA